MFYLIFSLYSYLAGIFAYYFFKESLFHVLIFLLLFEMFFYLIYRGIKRNWAIAERLFFAVFYLFVYFTFYVLYNSYQENNII